MKIVHIITRLILGGAQENTLITCKLLADRGHDVTLITGPAIGPEGALFEKAQGQGYDIKVIKELRRAINPWFDLISYLKIKHILKKIKPDIVHTHSAKAGILGRFAGHGLKGKFTDDHDIPYVIHSIHGLAFHPYQSDRLNKFYIAIEKAAADKTDAFICVADAMTEKTLAAEIGTPECFTTAYSAIEEEQFLTVPDSEAIKDFRRKHGINDQATVLVTVARLFDLKGHEYIVESAKKLAAKFDNCVWLFVGDGTLTDQLKSDIQFAGLTNKFKFAGLLPPDDIPLAIHASDILVHCSLREGLARVLPQAMLCGKPVVSFDIDGASEVVNENTGRLTTPEDIFELTEACAELIADPELRDRLGTAGRESVTEQFAPDTMVDVIERVYSKLVCK
jgi:glycosyltransferase involved in cell wall biosynthesis